jgi:threonylcarbamoyladenosine tRNA methylthiotransferase MtaB
VFGLGADVIAGFPGEAEGDHAATLALVRALPFTYLHVFPFSARAETGATRLPGHVPAPELQARAEELRLLGDEKARAHRASRVGQTADAVASGRSGGRVDALTEDYLSVYLPVEQWDGRARFPVLVD